MAKNWNDLFNNKIGVTKKDNRKALNKLMSEKTLDFDELKKHGNELYAKKIKEEDRLISLYNEKKLKDKDLIKEVRAIIKKREDSDKKED